MAAVANAFPTQGNPHLRITPVKYCPKYCLCTCCHFMSEQGSLSSNGSYQAGLDACIEAIENFPVNKRQGSSGTVKFLSPQTTSIGAHNT